jgi:hypothetical protein
MPHIPRTPNIAEELALADADLRYWKRRLHEAETADERIEARLGIGKATQRIRNLRREIQEGY